MSNPPLNKDKFTWPPKAISGAEVGPPADPGYWKEQGAREAPVVVTRARAVEGALAAAGKGRSESWPLHPNEAAAEAGSRETIALPVAAPPSGQSSAWWWRGWSWRRQVETAWFGLTRATLAERAVDAGWAPDELGSFCSRCGGSVGAHEEAGDGCPVCRGKRLPWGRFVRVGEYNGLLREVVHEVKFTAWRRLGMDAGRLLGGQLLPLLAGVEREKLVLVPVPSTLRRRLARGIDHTLVLARGVREVTGGRIERALARTHRPSQVGLPMTERRRNVAGTMRMRGRVGMGLAGCTVVVIDDVRTTGATMMEACRALGRGLGAAGANPAGVWAAVLGVAVEEGHGKGRGAGVAAELPTPHPQVAEDEKS